MSFAYCNAHLACPVCGATSQCRVSNDGSVHCHTNKRTQQPQNGYVFVCPSLGGTFAMYRHEDDIDRPRARRPVMTSPAPRQAAPAAQATPKASAASSSNSRFADIQKHKKSPPGHAKLAEHLGLPESALLEAGVEIVKDDGHNRPAWVFAERDGAGAIVGYNLRYLDGSKRTHGNPDAPVKRGLFAFPGWDERPGPLFCVEGASDTLTLAALGLAGVGRPNNSGGAAMFADLVRAKLPRQRWDIVVLGENDKKLNGDWPGRDGALTFARQVAANLGVCVRVVLPPDEAKDVRVWARQITKGDKGLTWEDAGQRLLKHLQGEGAILEVVRPEDAEQARTAALSAATRAAVGTAVLATLPPGTLAPVPARGGDGASAAAALTPTASAEDEDNARASRQILAVMERTRADADAWREQYHAAGRLMCADLAARRRQVLCEHCRKIVLENTSTGCPLTIDKRCEKWLCAPCRAYLQTRYAAVAALHFGATESAGGQLYELNCPLDDRAWDTIYARIRRLGGQYYRVVETCPSGREVYYIVTDRQIRGSLPCTAEQALGAVRLHLREFNPETTAARRAVSSSRGWPLLGPGDDDPPQFRRIGIAASGISLDTVEEIATTVGATARTTGPAGDMTDVQAVTVFEKPDGWSEEDKARLYASLFLGEPLAVLDFEEVLAGRNLDDLATPQRRGPSDRHRDREDSLGLRV